MSKMPEIPDCVPYIGKASGADFLSRYDEYVDFLNHVFRPDAPDDYFRSILPRLYNHPEVVRENSYIVSDPAGFIAAVGSFPFDAEICGRLLHGRIIGNVAVHPDHRSKGYMKTLMDMAMEDACSEGIDYMVLGGQRQRYQYFSFDSAGIDEAFTVTKTNIRHHYGSGRQPAVSLKPLLPGDDAALGEIAALYHAGPFYTVRPKSHLYETLTAWNSIPYVAYQGDRIAGYAVFYHDLSVITELRAAAPELLQEIIIAAALLSGKDGVTVKLAPSETDAAALLSGICEHCSIASDNKFTVLNFRNVVEAFLQLKATYAPLCDGSIVLGIDGRASYENLKITVSRGDVTVEPTAAGPDISLSHLEAMNLLFAPISPLRNTLPPMAAQWLPLPLYICNLDNA
ncbi:MAG: GNAT family N-acetyltransferase [Saccharofermentanales bacterium]